MRYTDKNGKKNSGASSAEAYKKLAWYENDEERGVIPEEYVYEPGKTPGKDYILHKGKA